MTTRTIVQLVLYNNPSSIIKPVSQLLNLLEIIEMNTAGTSPSTEYLKPNLNASPRLFTRAKSAESVNHDISTRNLTSRQ
jgi:hypothetical protein